jgi:hypothetical protein
VELDWRSIARRGLPTDRVDALVLLPLPDAEDVALRAVEAMIRAVADTGTIVVTAATEPALRDLAIRSGRKVITATSAEAAAEAAAHALA